MAITENPGRKLQPPLKNSAPGSDQPPAPSLSVFPHGVHGFVQHSFGQNVSEAHVTVTPWTLANTATLDCITRARS